MPADIFAYQLYAAIRTGPAGRVRGAGGGVQILEQAQALHRQLQRGGGEDAAARNAGDRLIELLQALDTAQAAAGFPGSHAA